MSWPSLESGYPTKILIGMPDYWTIGSDLTAETSGIVPSGQEITLASIYLIDVPSVDRSGYLNIELSGHRSIWTSSYLDIGL